MKLANSAHTSRPWRIHEIASDFAVEDVWGLPTPGGPDDFPRLLELFAGADPSASNPSRAARALFAIRWKLGALLGWDDEKADTPTLRDRLPADLRDTLGELAALNRFTALYKTDNEFAAEIANKTMHGIMHLSWVADDTGRYRGQMAVLVKTNGLFGSAYMLAIRPFRYLIVYPGMMRGIERRWQELQAQTRP